MKRKFENLEPNIVWYFFEDGNWERPKPNFEDKFLLLFDKIYSRNIIQRLQKQKDFVILGSDHGDTIAAIRIVEILIKLKKASPNLKVGLELLPPESIKWIKDFLKDEKEYKEKGTIYGKKPAAELVSKLRAYRATLSQNHGQWLCLWLLENGYSVVPIEHENVIHWIDQDERDSRLVNGFEGLPWHELRPFYTAIRRDVHTLTLLDKESLDVICVGAYHAIKLDFLLGRDGKNSHYFLTEEFVRKQFGWDLLSEMWQTSHEAYLKYPPK